MHNGPTVSSVHFTFPPPPTCVCGCLSPISVHSLLLSSHGGCIQRGDTSPLPPLPHPHHFHPSPAMKRGRGEGGVTPSLSPSLIIVHPLPHMHTTDTIRDLEGSFSLVYTMHCVCILVVIIMIWPRTSVV